MSTDSRFHRRDRVKSPDGLTGQVLVVSGANNLLIWWDDQEKAGEQSGWWMPDGFELVERPEETSL